MLLDSYSTNLKVTVLTVSSSQVTFSRMKQVSPHGSKTVSSQEFDLIHVNIQTNWSI